MRRHARTTFNDFRPVFVRLCWTLRVVWLLDRCHHFLRRGRALLRLLGLFVVYNECARNHWLLFIVFSQLTVEIIIIDFIKQCNFLMELLSKMTLRQVFEVLGVEGDRTDTGVHIVVNAATRRVIRAHGNIFGNESDDRFRIINKLFGEMDSDL